MPTTLHHLAFENSLQPNIISSPTNGKILLVNKAACKLLGYSKKEILTKSRADIFDIAEPAFRKMLKQRAAAGNSTASVTAIKKNGKSIPCEITSAIFIDADGVEKAITTIADISDRLLEQKKIDAKKEEIIVADIDLAKSKQKIIDQSKEKKVAADIVVALEKSEARLQENNEWIKYIAKTSYDVMWDWDIASGEIYVGDSLEEVFGYKVRANKIQFSDFIQCLLLEEKIIVENKLSGTLEAGNKSWDDTFMFKRMDGSVASTICRASIVRDEAGKATRMIGAIQDISRLQDLENQITSQQQLTEKFSLAAKVSIDVIWDWNLVSNELYIGDQFEELFGYKIENKKRIIPITDWGSYLHPDDKGEVDNKLREVIASTAIRWEQVYRFIRADGSIAQVFNRASIFRNPDGKAYRLIGTMQDLNRQKELQERIVDELEKKLPAREITAVTIKKLGLSGAIDAVIQEAMGSGQINITCTRESFSESMVSEKWKVNILQIVKEQLDNILKHAQATIVSINLSQNATSIDLTISDNGIGFDTGKRNRGTGIINIKSLATTYKGKTALVSKPGEGCALTVTFPLKNCLSAAQPEIDSEDRKLKLVESIKNIITEMILNSDERINSNFSDYLSNICHYDYTYLSNLFSEVEGNTIRKFIIQFKIDRVKELILSDELNLTQISLKLNYSSVAHLSNQFKKITGLTPSSFKHLKHKGSITA